MRRSSDENVIATVWRNEVSRVNSKMASQAYLRYVCILCMSEARAEMAEKLPQYQAKPAQKDIMSKPSLEHIKEVEGQKCQYQ